MKNDVIGIAKIKIKKGETITFNIDVLSGKVTSDAIKLNKKGKKFILDKAEKYLLEKAYKDWYK